METEGIFTADDLISTYTRAEAIEDGVLIDVSPSASLEGFRHPVAMTAGAYIDAVTEWCRFMVKPELDRLHEVLDRCSTDIRRGAAFGTDRAKVVIPTRTGEGIAYFLDLIVVCGPGDDGSPVITIMRPEDD